MRTTERTLSSHVARLWRLACVGATLGTALLALPTQAAAHGLADDLGRGTTLGVGVAGGWTSHEATPFLGARLAVTRYFPRTDSFLEWVPFLSATIRVVRGTSTGVWEGTVGLRLGWGYVFAESRVGIAGQRPLAVFHIAAGFTFRDIVSASAGVSVLDGTPNFVATATVGWAFRLD